MLATNPRRLLIRSIGRSFEAVCDAGPPSRRRSLLDRRSQLAIAVRGVLLAGPVLAAYFIVWPVTSIGTRSEHSDSPRWFWGSSSTSMHCVCPKGWRDGLTRNGLLHGAIALSLVLQWLVVHTATGNRLFTTTAMSVELWIVSGGLAVVAGLIVIGASAVTPWMSDED